MSVSHRAATCCLQSEALESEQKGVNTFGFLRAVDNFYR